MTSKLFLIILVLLGVTMAVPSTRADMLERARPLLDSFKVKLVPNRLEAMANQLQARVNRGEAFPNNWEGWLNRSYSGMPEDPWGNLYYFEPRRSDFTVGSLGPDGIKNSPDDIKVTRRLGR